MLGNGQGPPFMPYPIDVFYNSDVMMDEMGAVWIGGAPDFGQMGRLMFGSQNAGSAKKVEIIVGPLEQMGYED